MTRKREQTSLPLSTRPKQPVTDESPLLRIRDTSLDAEDIFAGSESLRQVQKEEWLAFESLRIAAEQARMQGRRLPGGPRMRPPRRAAG